ncbi:spidroin-1-like isoform X2 [Triticum urartu]|uniref:spidroin-1-like isoform X2 n=1 Tax=Triticum urartu TaxID=4572 RepID=UPI0020442B22|nr:spidroin-1-like isoform X2 [Triticum urartu]
MDGGGVEDGEGATEEIQCVAAEGSDLGAPADPGMASLGDGCGTEGSGQHAATATEGLRQRTASTGGGVSAVAITVQGGAWAEGSTAGVAGGSGQGTAGSGSTAVVGLGQYAAESASAAVAGSGQGAARLASTTWACPDGEPPKKRRKTTKSAQSSIVPRGDEAPATSMYFPPSQSLEITTKKKGKHSQTLEIANKKNGKRV